MTLVIKDYGELESCTQYNIFIPSHQSLILTLQHELIEEFTRVVLIIDGVSTIWKKTDHQYHMELPFVLNNIQTIQVKSFIYQTLIKDVEIYLCVVGMCMCPCEHCDNCPTCGIDKKQPLKKDYTERLWWDDEMIDSCVPIG